jgi:hypothetical protein
LGKKREAEPMNEHHSRREDNEYVRKGTCSVFIFAEPLGGRRYVSASSPSSSPAGARDVKSIVKEQYSAAEKVVLVMDNLNTHTLSSLYETFPAAEAFGIGQKPEVRYTPKHGSRLNIGEYRIKRDDRPVS